MPASRTRLVTAGFFDLPINASFLAASEPVMPHLKKWFLWSITRACSICYWISCCWDSSHNTGYKFLQWFAGTQSSRRPVRSFACGERVGDQTFSRMTRVFGVAHVVWNVRSYLRHTVNKNLTTTAKDTISKSHIVIATAFARKKIRQWLAWIDKIKRTWITLKSFIAASPQTISTFRPGNILD